MSNDTNTNETIVRLRRRNYKFVAVEELNGGDMYYGGVARGVNETHLTLVRVCSTDGETLKGNAKRTITAVCNQKRGRRGLVSEASLADITCKDCIRFMKDEYGIG